MLIDRASPCRPRETERITRKASAVMRCMGSEQADARYFWAARHRRAKGRSRWSEAHRGGATERHRLECRARVHVSRECRIGRGLSVRRLDEVEDTPETRGLAAAVQCRTLSRFPRCAHTLIIFVIVTNHCQVSQVTGAPMYSSRGRPRSATMSMAASVVLVPRSRWPGYRLFALASARRPPPSCPPPLRA